MIRPTLEESKKYIDDFTIIPVAMEILADEKTSVQILKTIINDTDKCFLLESVEREDSWGRYSFIGYEPKLTIKCTNYEIEMEGYENKKFRADDPKAVLKDILKKYKSPRISYLPPFTGGLCGYFAYDFIKYTENINFENENDNGTSDFSLMLFDKVIAIDHFAQKIFLIVNINTDFLENNYINAISKLKDMEALVKYKKPSKNHKGKLMSEFKPLYTKELFCHMVKKVKEHIFEGDIFQAVLSNRFVADFKGSLLESYRYLRTTNPSPYMFYFNFSDLEIIGASPETLIKLKDGKLTSFALAGTCKRGESKKEDEELISQMLADEKETAEHNMLVDLSRNDLGKVSEFKSVKVEEYMKVLKFSYVSHIASTITGKLKKEFDQIDALSAVLPAGTLSGAPKKRAVEIIESLENRRRGIYGGSIGYIDFTGNMDMCIGIRMAHLKDEKVYIQAGAGIVYDSDPDKEFEEYKNKSAGIIEAIKKSQEV